MPHKIKTLAFPTLACALAALVATGAGAFAAGGSNLPHADYPENICSKPVAQPSRPYEFVDRYERDRYNAEIAAHKKESERYLRCLHQYIDDANNDIERIREKIRDAADEAEPAR